MNPAERLPRDCVLCGEREYPYLRVAICVAALASLGGNRLIALRAGWLLLRYISGLLGCVIPIMPPNMLLFMSAVGSSGSSGGGTGSRSSSGRLRDLGE